MASQSPQVLDALIVGAGFSGVYLLHKLRSFGFNVKIYESGESLGGVWYWNCYPGARVDIECQIYQFSDNLNPYLWKNYHWKELYPDWKELRNYFNYVDEALELSKDISYNTRVTSATFDDSRNQWLVKTDGTGGAIYAKYFFLCTGFGSKRYTPNFKGLEKSKGEFYHTGAWPQNGVDLKGKRVSVIGTGASGVQVIQEIGPIVQQLTVYQRTPNLALPMKQSSNPKIIRLSDEKQIETFDLLPKTFGGFPLGFGERKALDVTPAERQEVYENGYAMGGAGLLVAFIDLLYVQEANDTAYALCVEKTRERINDPIKRDILAPLKPPHPFLTKRPSLEIKYYEVCDQSNVQIIDIRKSPIIEITEEGVKTEKEGVTPVDVLIFATGFDSYTGGILDIEITNGKGVLLRDGWGNGVRSNLGMAVSGFPNMFYTYGPQAPTAFANGPTSAQIQGEWLSELLVRMREGNKNRIEATEDAENVWIKIVQDLWTNSLFPKADSWYQGANIPGKRREAYNFVGGLPMYTEALERSASNNYEGFIIN